MEIYTIIAPTAIERIDMGRSNLVLELKSPFRLAEILTFVPVWFMIFLGIATSDRHFGISSPGLFFILVFFMMIIRVVFIAIFDEKILSDRYPNTIYLAHRVMLVCCWVSFILLYICIQEDLGVMPPEETDYIDFLNDIPLYTGILYFIATLLLIPVAKKAHQTEEFIHKQNSSSAAEFRENVMNLINDLDRYEGKSKNQLTYSKKQIKEARRMK